MLSCFLAACQPEPASPPVAWEPVKVQDLYQLDLPNFLQMGYDMHEYASLQYYNLEKGIFILGIEDAKENLGDIKRRRLKLPGYFAFVEDIVMEAADTTFLEAACRTSLPGTFGHKVMLHDYYVANEEWAPMPLFYRIAVYESSEYFFQIVIWMPYENHCKHYSTVERITRSFTLLTEALGHQKPQPSLTGNRTE